MSNVNEPLSVGGSGELDKVDWTTVSDKLTDTLRRILGEELKGSPLADQIAEVSEVRDFVSYDPHMELPPPLEGPLGNVESILRKQLYELLLSYGVPEEVANHTAPVFFQTALTAQGTNCTFSSNQQGNCTIITRRCRYC